jgi:DNA-binding NtrC family response regulator
MIARRQPQALVLNSVASFEAQIGQMMTELSWDFEVVSDSTRLLARLRATTFTVMIIDYSLPELPQGNGLHLLSCLRQKGITLPAIMMSEDEEALRTVPKELLNIPAVLLKPFKVSDLRGALDSVCVA